MSQKLGLVAYGSDSDDEEVAESGAPCGISFQVTASSSPAPAPAPAQENDRKSSDESFRKRARRRNSEHFTDEGSEGDDSDGVNKKRSRDATDSPAPPVHPAMKRLGIPQTTSQVSLVSYGGDEEDDFEKEDLRISQEEAVRSPSRSGTGTAEPKPPRGHDEDGDKDESPEIIGAELENFEAVKVAWKHEDSSTPQSMGSVEDETIEERKERENAVRMPSPPTERCAPELESFFEKLFQKKFDGLVNPTRMIQERQDFKNPSIYEQLIEAFNLDECGSNFPPSVYDPHIFDESGPEKGQGYFDRIREKQCKMEQSLQAKRSNADSKSKSSSSSATSASRKK